MSPSHLKSLLAKLNETCSTALQSAIGACYARTHGSVEIEHFLQALLAARDNDLYRILEACKLQREKLAQDLEEALRRLPCGSVRPPGLSRLLLACLREAWLVASLHHGEPRVRSGHVLLALLRSPELADALYQGSSEWEKVESDALDRRLAEICADTSESARQDKAGATNASGAEGSALHRYTIDLTERARRGQLDEVIGREAEICNMVAVLLRRRQNNPILVGEAGVGKTAVVEGLALRIAAADVPEALRSVALRSLDLGLLQAGASVRGEFESRLKAVISEVQQSPQPVILFIDEAHTLIGSGGAAGQGDAANLLKPALARGELRTIAATTWAEYKQYIEDDAALARRFQVVKIGEPSDQEAAVMLRGLVPSFEAHHQVRIKPDAIVAAVHMSRRYVADRHLPDKAVSVLSTACAQVSLSQQAEPAALGAARRRLLAIEQEEALLRREARSDAETRERLAILGEEHIGQSAWLAELTTRLGEERRRAELLRDLRQRLEQQPEGSPRTQLVAELSAASHELRQLQGEQPLVHECVDAQAIAAVIASWTGIPVGKMLRDELGALLDLESALRRRVLGQDSALHTLSERLRTERAGLGQPGRPLGVFLLLGPSGVGKTETALAIADALYGGERNVITINMSEYKEPHSAAALKGAPPGYVGYGKGGVLTEAVRRRPYSVVLLDEFEKANREVQQQFFSAFDKGVLQDGMGREISFRNALFILTSNVGARTITRLCTENETRPSAAALLAQVQPELLAAFDGPLLGRMFPVPYYPLRADTMREILSLQLARLAERLRDSHRATLEYDEELLRTLVGCCPITETGARAIEQLLHREVVPILSRALLARLAESRPALRVRLRVKSRECTGSAAAPAPENGLGIETELE